MLAVGCWGQGSRSCCVRAELAEHVLREVDAKRGLLEGEAGLRIVNALGNLDCTAPAWEGCWMHPTQALQTAISFITHKFFTMVCKVSLAVAQNIFHVHI